MTSSWTVVMVFVACCTVAYMHASNKKQQVQRSLLERLQELEIAKQVALAEKKMLELEIQSQSDPLWIQLTLMKGLGLVPEGQKKVLFHE